MPRLLAIRALAFGAILLASGSAVADIQWNAPAGCPDAVALRERIARRLPDTMSIADAGTIEITVARSGTQFIATIDTRAISVAGQGRTLKAARCDELADAVALIVARLATDARRNRDPDPAPRASGSTEDKTTRADQPGLRSASNARKIREARAKELVAAEIEMLPLASAVGAPSEIEMPAETVERPRVAASSARPTSWSGGIRALALTGIGMTPDVGVGADLAGYVQRENQFVEVGFAKWAPRPMYLLPGGIGQVDFSVQLVALRAGWASKKMPLRGWAGVELGEMHGEGMALRTPDSGTGRWIAITSGFGVGWPLSARTRVVGTFEVAVPVERAKFTFMDGTEVREPAPISARSALGLEVAWR